MQQQILAIAGVDTSTGSEPQAIPLNTAVNLTGYSVVSATVINPGTSGVALGQDVTGSFSGISTPQGEISVDYFPEVRNAGALSAGWYVFQQPGLSLNTATVLLLLQSA